jgi:DNA-binding NarL/FixJ family response regulator
VPSQAPAIRVVLAEDGVLPREGLAGLLEQFGFAVVAAAGDAADLLDSCDGRGVGYLLKDRVGDVEEFVASLRRVASGGTVVDPQVISQLVRRRRVLAVLAYLRGGATSDGGGRG